MVNLSTHKRLISVQAFIKYYLDTREEGGKGVGDEFNPSLTDVDENLGREWAG